jgi:hypothetical protein
MQMLLAAEARKPQCSSFDALEHVSLPAIPQGTRNPAFRW